MKICKKCLKREAMKTFDVCFECYIGLSKPMSEIIQEERNLSYDVFD